MGFSKFLALAYTLGPAYAIPYATGFMSFHEIILSLIILYSIPLPLIFLILQKKPNNRLTRGFLVIVKIPYKVTKKTAENITQLFEQKMGYHGYYASLIFISFSLGFLWAAVIAYLMNFHRKAAYLCILTGTIIGLLFWSAVTYFSLKIVSPTTLICIFLLISFLSFINSWMKEKEVIKTVKNKLKRKRK